MAAAAKTIETAVDTAAPRTPQPMPHTGRPPSQSRFRLGYMSRKLPATLHRLAATEIFIGVTVSPADWSTPAIVRSATRKGMDAPTMRI